jgi:hypothetical protein
MNISKRIFLVIVLLIMNRTCLIAQTTICIPYGAPSVIDGNISIGEWSDADTVQITVSVNKKVTVKYKHDSLNLYLAYCKNLESALRFPEVVMDINNDKSTSWMADDWWFHVSATDCESNMTPNNYSNCLAVQPGWQAIPNMVSGPPYTDTIEIKIPFVKVGINLHTNDTIGLAFDVTNTSTIWNYWPLGSVINNPSTWANAVFCATTVGLNDLNFNRHTKIFPNPFSSQTTFQTNILINNATLTVYNSQWQTVQQILNITGQTVTISRDNLSSGLYFVQLKQDNKILTTNKLVITD